MRELPHSNEAERALIGSVLLDCTLMADVGVVSLDDFFSDRHKVVWKSIQSSQPPFDMVTVGQALRDSGEMERAGGVAYYSGLVDGIPADKSSVQRYAAIVREKSRQRSLVKMGELLMQRGFSGNDSRGTARDFIEMVSPLAAAPPGSRKVLARADEFSAMEHDQITWIVPGAIQAGANGFVCASPKVGKSWLMADLCIALAEGRPWLGIPIDRRRKVALISREDNPALTRWRLSHLSAEGLDALSGWLWVNTRAQSKTFSLTNAEEHAEMVSDLERVGPELVIFDVLNVLHAANENDNTEMVGVLKRLSEIQAEVGCSIAVVHHFNKLQDGSLTTRMRGSSAIAGWAEWVIGVERIGEKARKVTFDLKAAESPEPIYFEIQGLINGGIGVQVVQEPAEEKHKTRRLA